MEKFWTKEQLRAFIRENGLASATDAQQACFGQPKMGPP